MTLGPGDYVRLVEDRRRAAEGVLWQLPGISLAAQAFLLSVGLSADAEPTSQKIVGALGIAAVFGTSLFIIYQTVRATIFGSWVSQMVCQPLRPEEIATERLKFSHKRICLIEWVFWAFYATCIVALLFLLAADVYVFGLGVGWW